MTDHLHALAPGTALSDYRIERVLGVGGFGITYLARDNQLRKAYAIKEYLPNEFALRSGGSTVLPKSSSDKVDFDWGMARFLDEARTLATFDHPNLNAVHRFFEANGTAYMVLVYEKGETLAQRLKRTKTLPESDLRILLNALLSGLGVIHQGGFVHRDIKPSNIIIREDGTPVLLDFGAARAAIGQRSKSITTILTPGYAPVEQYDQTAEDVGPWTDIYALGMVAYRCVTGFSDYQLMDAITRMRLQRKGDTDKDLQPSLTIVKGYTVPLLCAIDHAIQVNEENRQQSVAAFLTELADDEATVVAPRRLAAMQEPPLAQTASIVTLAPTLLTTEKSNSEARTRSPRVLVLLLGVISVVLVGILVLQFGGISLPVLVSTKQTKIAALEQEGKIQALALRLAQAQEADTQRLQNSPELLDLLNQGIYKSAALTQLIGQHKAAQSLLQEKEYDAVMAMLPKMELGYTQLLQKITEAESLYQASEKVIQLHDQWVVYALAHDHEQDAKAQALQLQYQTAMQLQVDGSWVDASTAFAQIEQPYANLLEYWKQQDDPQFQKEVKAKKAYDAYKAYQRDVVAKRQKKAKP